MIICLGTTPAYQRTLTFSPLRRNEVNRAIAVKTFASGKPINVGRVLHAIAQPALVTGFVGGAAGKFIRDDLDQSGIAHDFVTVQQETRTCLTLLDQTDQSATELVEESATVDAGKWDDLLYLLQSHLKDADSLVLSGSLAPGAPPAFYATCVRVSREAGIPAILDAKGEPLREALVERPYVIKPNHAEVEATVGRKLSTDADLLVATRELLAAGAVWAVVTEGSAGAIVCDRQNAWRIHVPKVEVINPIGSGDAFAAGLAAGLARGADVPEASLLATACALANTLTPHAGFVNKSDVENFLQGLDLLQLS